MRFATWMVVASLGFVMLRLAAALAFVLYLGVLVHAVLTQPAATLGLMVFFSAIALLKAQPLMATFAAIGMLAIMRITSRKRTETTEKPSLLDRSRA